MRERWDDVAELERMARTVDKYRELAATQKLSQRCLILGVGIALDDFGAGYSHLASLKQLTVDTLKLDRSYVQGMLGDAQDLSLVEGLNGIAIWQDPTMAPLPDAHLNGNGNFNVKGTIYFPDPIHCRLEGDLGDTGNQVLCGTAKIMGTAEVNIDYDGRNGGDSTARSCLVW